MKKILMSAILLAIIAPMRAFCEHLELRNASTLSAGQVANFLLDNGSITKQGNNISFSTVAAGSQELRENVRIATTAITLGIKAEFRTIYISTWPRTTANIVSTTSAGFDFAISSLGGQSNSSSGTIIVDPGDYYMVTGVTVPAGITINFLPGSVLKWDQLVPWHDTFITSGTINDCTVEYTAGVAAESFGSVFVMMGKAVVNRPNFKTMNMTAPAGLFVNGFMFRFDYRANGAAVYDLFAPSVTVNGTGYRINAFVVSNATNCSIVRPFYRQAVGQGGSVQNRAVIYHLAGGVDGLKIVDGYWETTERLYWVGDGGGGGVYRNFVFEGNTVIMNSDPHGNGLLALDGVSAVSSGTVVRNNYFYGKVPIGATIVSVNAGAPTTIFPGMIIEGNVINLLAGGSGTCFLVATTAGIAAISTILANNYCNGTTTFLTDTGSNTKSANNRNHLNSVAQ